MPNDKKILYGVEDYLQDKEGGATTTGRSATVLPAPATAAAPTQTAAPAPTQISSSQIAPASASAPTAPTQAPSVQMGTGEAGAVSPTQPMSMSDMWKAELTNARNKVYEVMNKKFTYNEKSSPLYSILQKQYEREADRAAGQAYARSVANTGGFGSSYATLAADEARRRTMEGFDDQQLALYEAAKEEFFAERQSSVDWYNQVKQMYGDAVSEDLTNAYDEGIAAWLENGDEDAVRELLTNAGYNESTINNAITMMKEYSVTQGEYDAALEDQRYQKDYNNGSTLASTLANEGKTDQQIKDALIAAGINPSVVDQIMSERLDVEYNDAGTAAALKTLQNDEAATNAYNAGLELWLETEDVNAVREQLVRAGYNTDAINRALSAMRAYSAEVARIDRQKKEDEAAVKEQELAQEVTSAYNSVLDAWLTSKDEAAIRDALKSAGYSSAAINKAVLMLKQYSVTKNELDAELEKQESTASGTITDEQKNDLFGSVLEGYDGTNKEQIKTDLQNSGVSEEDTNEIIGRLEESERAGLDDSAKQVSDITSAVDHKAELDASLKNGTLSVEEYDRRIAENSAKVMNEITLHLDDMSEIDYEALGISKAEWEAMDDGDRKLSVFDALGEMVKEGIVTHSDYERMLEVDTREMFASEEYKESKTKTRDAVDRAVVIQDLYDSGYLLQDEYIRLLYNEIAPQFENTNGFKYLLFAWDNYTKKDDKSAENFFEYATGNGITSGVNATMSGDFANISDDQKEVVFEMVKWIYGRPGRAEANAKAIEEIRSKIVTNADAAHKASNEKGKDRVGNQNVNFKV